MRLVALFLAIPAAVAVNLRTQSSAALSAVPPPPPPPVNNPADPKPPQPPAADKADCVEAATAAIASTFKDFEEINDTLSSMPDGSKCKLDQESIDKAQAKAEAAQKASEAADAKVTEAKGAKAPCCTVAMSELEASNSAGTFPASLSSCEAFKESVKNLKELQGIAAAQPAIVKAAQDHVAEVIKSAKESLNKCICDAEDSMNEAFTKAQESEKTKGPEREKSLLLEKAVICAKKNSDAGGPTDACDNLSLSADEKAKLVLKKPTLAAGLVCKRAPPPAPVTAGPVVPPVTAVPQPVARPTAAPVVPPPAAM